MKQMQMHDSWLAFPVKIDFSNFVDACKEYVRLLFSQSEKNLIIETNERKKS